MPYFTELRMTSTNTTYQFEEVKTIPLNLATIKNQEQSFLVNNSNSFTQNNFSPVWSCPPHIVIGGQEQVSLGRRSPARGNP